MRKEAGAYEPLFRLESWRVIVEKRADGKVDDRGDDQDLARRRALRAHRRGQRPRERPRPRAARRHRRDPPAPRDIELVNFKVRILDETKGTGAVTRVLIDASDGHDVWGSIGVSENLIAASWDALVDSLEYGMQPAAAAGSPPRLRSARRPAARRRECTSRSRSPGRCWARPRSAPCSRCCARAALAGPAPGGVRARLRRARGRAAARAPSAAAPPACTWRCAPSAWGRATRSSRARSRSSPPPTRRCTSARGPCSRTSTPSRSTSTRTRPPPPSASARARCCPCTSSATPPTCPPSSASRRRHDLAIVEDACEALGALHADGVAVGGRGHPAVFGFYANKQLTTGEGGMVTLADGGVEGAHRLRAKPGSRAGHGLARPRPARLQLPPIGHRLRARHRAARAARGDARRAARASPRSTARRSPGSRSWGCRARTRRAAARVVRVRRAAAARASIATRRSARSPRGGCRASPTSRRST